MGTGMMPTTTGTRPTLGTVPSVGPNHGPRTAEEVEQVVAGIAGDTRNPLARSCMLANLHVRMWSARRQDKAIARAATDKYALAKGRAVGSKYLVPAEKLEAIQSAAGAIRTAFYKVTLPWFDDGARVMSAKAYFAFGQEFPGLKQGFFAAVEKFSLEYPHLRAQAATELGTLFQADQYPTVIRERFDVDLTIFPFPRAEDFRVQGLDHAIEEGIREKLATLPQTIEARAREEVARRVTEVAERIVDRMTTYTGGKDGAFRDTLITNVKELADTIPLLNVADDSRMADVARRLEGLAQYKPEELRKDEGARLDAKETAQGILDKMADFIG